MRMQKTGILIAGLMLAAAGLPPAQAQTNATNTAIMLRNGTNLVPTNAVGVLSNALGLQPWATNTNTPLFVDTNGVVTSTNAVTFPVLRTSEEIVMLGAGADASYGGVAIGANAYSLGGGVAVGRNSTVNNGGAIGDMAQAGDGFAGGLYAKALGDYNVQLGEGSNSAEYTLQFRSFPLVDAGGKIPVERFPAWAASTNPGVVRTNLGMPWPGLTNTNAEGFRNSLGLGANDVPNFAGLNIGDGAGISPDGFWGHEFGGALSFEEGRLEFFINSSNSFGLNVGGLYFSNNPTAQANTRTNIGLGASWLTNSNVPTPYSGAAPTGAILTADGAGGSAFVAAGGRVGYTTSSNFTKTSWAAASIQQATNVATTPFPSFTLNGGKTYRIEYLVRFNGDGATNGFPVHGIVIATNVVGGHTMWVGTGINSIGSASGINVSTNSGQTWLNFPPTVSSNLRTISGSAMIHIPTNTTAVYSWCPSVNVTNTWTLEAPSSVFVTEMP